MYFVSLFLTSSIIAAKMGKSKIGDAEVNAATKMIFLNPRPGHGFPSLKLETKTDEKT